VIKPHIHDMQWAADTDPDTEQLVGIQIVHCTDFDIVDPLIRNLIGLIGSAAPRAYQTDGFTIGASSFIRMVGGSVQNCGEGVDITGSDGCSRISLTGMQAINCDSFGFKFANTIAEATIVGCIAYGCGYAGFTVSGTTVENKPNCEDITFVGCRAMTTGSNGKWTTTNKVSGFLIFEGEHDKHLPANIRFIECEAIDEQAMPTMQYGFYNQIAPSALNVRANRMIGCQVVGASVAPTGGYIGDYWCRLTRGSDHSVSNNTATLLPWDAEADDPYDLHAPNSTAVVVRESGLYDIRCQIEFASAASGFRLVTLVLSGSGTGIRDITIGSSVTTATASISTLQPLAKDTSIEIEVYQNSGGSLNVRAGLCRLEVRKVYGAM
jgi:hypothetical protein